MDHKSYRKQTHYTMSANPSFGSDELGISKGTILGDHHMVEAFLGEGSFGVVTKCRDTKNNKTVAIKVNKSDPEILLQAKLEIFILEQLRRLDPDRCNIVEWNGYFLDGERICLNFELLDQSLSDYIGDRNNQGLPMREIRPILHQLANALFHLGSVGIVHADLKPVNIMVVNRSESQVRVKLIDFGIACNTSAVIPGDCVGTIGYCAPEIMLGTPYDEAIDMWSLGLVAVELATGVPLYPGEDDYDVLKFIIETQGQLPDHLLESGLYTDSYFIEDNHNEHVETDIKRRCTHNHTPQGELHPDPGGVTLFPAVGRGRPPRLRSSREAPHSRPQSDGQLLLAPPLQQAAENGGGRRLQTSLHPLIVVLMHMCSKVQKTQEGMELPAKEQQVSA
uniref:Protein kinase domain-containing protein n=1 Tax=Maylandia zebra TaxID=106582 RepID=A0A3P9B807_9CICH